MDLEKLKSLLGIPAEDTTRDASLRFVLDDVLETVLNYCNQEELPAGLVNTACRMAVDLYRAEQPGTAGDAVRVASITAGDTSTRFIGAADALADGILKDYRGQLNRYRRLG